MCNGGAILDHRHFQTCGLQGADGGFSAGAGTLDKHFDGLQTVLFCRVGGSLRGGLRGKGGRLLASTEAQEIALPCVSVMVTMVLLKEELI